jgi:monoamine oxidase
MIDSDILIIGAGACGLMAAYELKGSGKNIVVIEAQNRLGGRIHTLHDNAFLIPVETGAEFIHGDFPITTSLLQKANIKYYEVNGKMFQVRDGKLHRENDFIEDSRQLEKKMNKLEHDISIKDFLNTHFPGKKYEALRETTIGFVEGYDAADAERASTFAFRDEWNNSSMKQYRIEGGYKKLIDYLETKCLDAGIKIQTGIVATKINWHTNHVELYDANRNIYKASKVIITIPPPLICEKQGEGDILFSPDIPSTIHAAKDIGFGNVIKITMQFKEAFWKSKEVEQRLEKSFEELSFIFSDAFVPTWWTQLPYPIPILTGWLAGPKAKKIQNADNETILQEGLHSLAYIFQTTAEELEKKISAWHVTNWGVNPFSQGAYSYSTLKSSEARKELRQAVDNTIYFAGEALDDGNQSGTVEAALADGKRVAEKIRKE